MKKVEGDDKQRKEGKCLFVIVDFLVKIVLLMMISLLSSFRIYTPRPPTPAPSPPLEISVYDQFSVDDEISHSFFYSILRIPIEENTIQFSDMVSHSLEQNTLNITIEENTIQFSDMVSHSLEQEVLSVTITETPIGITDNVSHSLIYNEISIQLSDTIYMSDTLSLQLLYVVTSTKYDGYTIPAVLYVFAGKKYDGYSIPITIYNSVSTKYDGYSISSITV